jgi:hypothetical protein
MAANASVIRADAPVLASSSLVVVPAGPAGGALGSGVAQLALLHFFGSGVAVGSVAQSPALHKPSVVGGLVARIKESDRSAVLVKFSRAFVGRTQPMMLHSAGARGVADGAGRVLACHRLRPGKDECESGEECEAVHARNSYHGGRYLFTPNRHGSTSQLSPEIRRHAIALTPDRNLRAGAGPDAEKQHQRRD